MTNGNKMMAFCGPDSRVGRIPLCHSMIESAKPILIETIYDTTGLSVI